MNIARSESTGQDRNSGGWAFNPFGFCHVAPRIARLPCTAISQIPNPSENSLRHGENHPSPCGCCLRSPCASPRRGGWRRRRRRRSGAAELGDGGGARRRMGSGSAARLHGCAVGAAPADAPPSRAAAAEPLPHLALRSRR